MVILRILVMIKLGLQALAWCVEAAAEEHRLAPGVETEKEDPIPSTVV